MTSQAHVHGRDPLSEKGQYFVASPWSWQVLLTLISIADMRHGSKLITDDQFAAMNFSSGAGIEDKAACNILANELETMMQKPALLTEHDLRFHEDDGEVKICIPDGVFGFLVDEQGRLYSSAKVKPEDAERLKLTSAHSISVTKVLEFAAFLKSCNGFSLT